MEKNLMMKSMKSSSSVNDDVKVYGDHAQLFSKTSSLLGPTLTYYDGRIVHYDTSTSIYSLWSLFTTANTIIQSRRTWVQMLYMTGVSFISFMIVHNRGLSGSITSTAVTDIASEMRVLMSFVLGGYILLCVEKWRITGSHVTTIIRELSQLLKEVDILESGVVDVRDRESLFRYCRLSLQLIFFTGSQQDDLSELVTEGLLSDKEKSILHEAPISCRSDIVSGWLDALLMKIKMYEKCASKVVAARSCSRELADDHYRQLPFMYAHCVYWGIQFIFVALACQTGIMLAIFVHTKSTGNGTYDDDGGPDNPNTWLANASIGMVLAKIVFLVFTNGLLHVCERIQNPLDGRKSSFSRRLNDAVLVSTCSAYRSAVKTLVE